MTKRYSARWFASLVVMLTVLVLSGCFDKEGDQRKAFSGFLQNTVLRGGETLPVLSADQKKRFGVFVSDYQVLFHYAQQVNQAMDEGVRPLVDVVNLIHKPQDYLTHRDNLRHLTDSLAVLNQQLINDKLQADSDLATLKLAGDLRPVYVQAYQKIVTTPANTLQTLIPVAQDLARQLTQVGDFIRQQGADVKFVGDGVQLPTMQQVNQYNALIAPLAAQYQAFDQAYQTALNTIK